MEDQENIIDTNAAGPLLQFTDKLERDWAFNKRLPTEGENYDEGTELWTGLALDKDGKTHAFTAPVEQWTEETLREHLDTQPDLFLEDAPKNPATGETEQDRIDRGAEGVVETEAATEVVQEPDTTAPLYFSLKFDEAKKQGAEIGQWCHVNGAEHKPDFTERKYIIVVPAGTELPKFIQELVIG